MNEDVFPMLEMGIVQCHVSFGVCIVEQTFSLELAIDLFDDWNQKTDQTAKKTSNGNTSHSLKVTFTFNTPKNQPLVNNTSEDVKTSSHSWNQWWYEETEPKPHLLLWEGPPSCSEMSEFPEWDQRQKNLVPDCLNLRRCSSESVCVCMVYAFFG